MPEKVLVVAPHPDDETLGCGGALLRHAREGDETGWLIVTGMKPEYGFAAERCAERRAEIEAVRKRYGFTYMHACEFQPAHLDRMPMSELVGAVSEVMRAWTPTTVYIPYRADIHTDHAAVFDAVVACTKWFRYPSIERVLVYETLSETDFSIDPDARGFRPQVFVDISEFLAEKMQIAQIYQSEFSPHPFPRSLKAIESLAVLRGAAAGFDAAEAFMLLKERR